MGYSLLLSLFILILKLFQISPASLQPGSCVLWTHPHHSLSTSLISGTRCSKLIMFFACPSPEISHFSKDLRFFLVENGIKAKVWALLPLGCHCSQAHSKDIYIFTYTHRCKYIQTYANIYIYVYTNIYYIIYII